MHDNTLSNFEDLGLLWMNIGNSLSAAWPEGVVSYKASNRWQFVMLHDYRYERFGALWVRLSHREESGRDVYFMQSYDGARSAIGYAYERSDLTEVTTWGSRQDVSRWLGEASEAVNAT